MTSPEEQRDLALVLAEDIFGIIHCITQGNQEGAYVEVWHCKSGAIVKLTFAQIDGIDHMGNPAVVLHVHALNTTQDQGKHYIDRWQAMCVGGGWASSTEMATA
jgi:hypothetical protein